MSAQFPRLLGPSRLGNLELRNRLVMPAMCTNFANEDGTVSQRLIDYHEARARGGVGLIIVEASTIDSPLANGVKRHVYVDDDRFIPGLSALAETIRRHGAGAALQIVHAGAAAYVSLPGKPLVGPSAVARPGGAVPRELTLAEIEETVRHFARAARRAQKAGFDGVEIHCAHGYLVSEFLSSYFNRRTDRYGGGLENRARLMVEILQATRELVGPDYPIWIRLNGAEFGSAAGLTQDEARQVAAMAEAAGACAINVSLSSFEMNLKAGPPTAQVPGNLIFLAESIKKAVQVPVMSMGRHDPASGEAALEKGQADLIVMGRRLIADPELPNKAASGRLDEIRPCLGCMTCLDCITAWHVPVYCAVNGAVGREREFQVQAADRPRKVFVVGGGPAGMEAARVARLRGHEVSLFERASALGGQLRLASRPPYKAVIRNLADYQQAQLHKLGVKVILGQAVGPEMIAAERPEGLILAAGARPIRPEIPGQERAEVVLASDVLAGKAPVGERAAVIGGDLVGCETAEFLAKEGRKVTVIELLDQLARKLNPRQRDHLLARLAADENIEVFTGVRRERITAEGLVITTREGQERTVAAETIVIAVGSQADTSLAEALPGGPLKVVSIGDCLEPRDIASAMREGIQAGLAV